MKEESKKQTRLKDLVALIDDKVGDLGDIKLSRKDKIVETTRSSDDDLGLGVAESLELCLSVDLSDETENLDAGDVLCEALDLVLDLDAELACVHDDDGGDVL